MHPQDLDGDEPGSGAERAVFDAIRDRLPEPWEAFHGTGFTERDHATGTRDGEIDFVLAHPDVGIFCLEVKGGGVECRDGAWYRTHRDGPDKRMRDPFEQAKGQRHALKRLISAAGSGVRGEDLLMGHAVAFPYATVHALGPGLNAPRELTVDRSDMDDLPAAAERIAAYHRGSRDRRRAPGEEGMELLRRVLAPTVRIAGPLAAAIAQDEAALIELTNEQTLVLRGLAANPRVAVTGCAGSGKTLIAFEHARRLAREKSTVLFVCFNRALREELRPRAKTLGIEVQTFHGLCTALAGKAGVSLPDHPPGEAPKRFFEEDLPAALVEAAAKLDLAYDALFVDEAQDLRTSWLEALTCVLREPNASPMWLFLDDSQQVYEHSLKVPDGYARWELSVNCRNTRRIHELVRRYYTGAVVPSVRGPEGREPELIHTDDPAAAVAAVVERLCGEEGIPPQDVVVLSEHGYDTSAVPKRGGGRFAFVRERGMLGNNVQLSSIRAFKGLESPVVILCELEDMRFPDKQSQLLYTGISRARTHLVVVAPPKAELAAA